MFVHAFFYIYSVFLINASNFLYTSIPLSDSSFQGRHGLGSYILATGPCDLAVKSPDFHLGDQGSILSQEIKVSLPASAYCKVLLTVVSIQNQNQILCLIFSNLSPEIIGDQCLLQVPRRKFQDTYACLRGSLSGSGSKESACNVGEPGLVPGLGRSLEKEMAAHSSILAWIIPWTGSLVGYSSCGHKE